MTLFRRLRARAGMLLCGLTLLAGCGNDPDLEGSFALVQSAAATAFGPLFGDGNGGLTPAASTPEALAPVLAQLPPGPVLRFEVPEFGQSALAYSAARNGPYRTFATVTSQTITMRGDLVTGTRGFAWDLMSSATNGAGDIVRRRGSGSVQRIYRFLGPMDDDEELVVTCTIAPDGSEGITLASGARFATTRMRETCTGEGATFTNRYWVTSGGAIPRSEQWISDRIGAFRIERVRN